MILNFPAEYYWIQEVWMILMKETLKYFFKGGGSNFSQRNKYSKD